MKYTELDLTYVKKLAETTHPHLKDVVRGWQTEEYVILLDYPAGFVHLRITRMDEKPIHNYLDMQQIKNDLLADEIVAIEIYPAKSQLVDTSNTYHLWSWPNIENEIPNLLKLYRYNP